MDTTLTSPATEIIERLLNAENPSYTSDVARIVLDFRFPDTDIGRINELAEKSRVSDLTKQESAERDAYLWLGSLIDLMHSKARLSLKNSGPAVHV